MARIAGVNIPAQKRVEIALRYIYGIGPMRATAICSKIGIPTERSSLRMARLSVDCSTSSARAAR